MNKEKKTYVEPNMKVMEVEAEAMMAGSECQGTGSGEGAGQGDSTQTEFAKPDFGSDESSAASGWNE